MEADSSKTNGSAGSDEPEEEVEERRAPDMQLDFDDLAAAEKERAANEGGQAPSEPPISEQPESDAEPISLRDLEMVFAPGVAPPPLPDAGKPKATSTPPPLPGKAARPVPPAVESAPGSDPEIHVPAPPDSDYGDIAAFASLNPPPVKSKRAARKASRSPRKADESVRKADDERTQEEAPAPTDADIPGAPRLPSKDGMPAERARTRRRDSDRPESDGSDRPEAARQDSDRPRPPRKLDKRRIQDEPTSDPPPGSGGRRGRRSERPTKESGSGIHDLRMIVSMHPVAEKSDVDDEMLNLSGGLFKEDAPLAPIIAPDLSAFSTDAADEAPPPSRRAKRRKKHHDDDSPPSSRSPDSVPYSRRAKTKSGAKGAGAARKKSASSEDSRRERKSKDRAAESTRAKAQAEEPESKSRLGLWIFAAAALAVGAYVYVSSTGDDTPTPTAESGTRTSPQTGDSPPGAKPTPTEATAKATDTGTAEDTASAANTQTDSGTGTATGSLPEGAWQPGAGTATGATDTGGAEASGTDTGTEAGGTDSGTDTGAGEEPPEAPKAEFNKGAASAALSAAAGAASGCRTGGDPAGSARVMVTFAPSGRVTQALVSGPPFAGTPTGGCIARAFRSAKVPPFEGSPVTVAKTARIQ